MKNYYIEKESAGLKENGVLVFEQSLSGPFLVHNHIHEAIEIIYMFRGKAVAYIDDVVHPLNEGDLAIFRSNTRHSIFVAEKAEATYYVLKANLSWIFELSEKQDNADQLLRLVINSAEAKSVWYKDEEDSRRVLDSFKYLLNKTLENAPCKGMAVKAGAGMVFYEIMKYLIEHDYRIPDYTHLNNKLVYEIYKAIIDINKQFDEDLQLEGFARKANVSYSYYSRNFKAIIGKSFKEYLNFVRVARAEQLLCSSDMSITEIAFKCGFNNTSYFASVYRGIKGITPMAARKKVKSIFSEQKALK